MKVYCSFDDNDVLTGWTMDSTSFSTTEIIREIELTEDEVKQLEENFLGFFKFENDTLVFYKQEFLDELKLLKLEQLAVKEEKKAEEFSTIMNRLNM